MIVNPIIPIWIIVPIIIGILIFFRSKEKKTFIRQIIIFVLLFIINLRIMLPSSEGTLFLNNLDVLFVIDNTISMYADDYNGEERMTAVKNDCEYIMNKLAGAKFSVITFTNNSKILTPYTRDINVNNNSIKALQTGVKYYSRGSSLNSPKDDMKTLLNFSKQKGDRKSVVFFISDGEITSKEELQSYSELKDLVDNGAVLGYGTENGGYMQVRTSYSSEEKEYVEDPTSYPRGRAKSKLDSSNLSKIANDLGIEYIYMDKQSNLDNKLNELENMKKVENIDNKENTYGETYYLFSMILVGMLIYEFIRYRRRL